jgi:ribosome-binding factor A
MANRQRRVNEEIKEILADALVDVKDPRIGFLTLTDVRTTTDYKSAEVFYTVLPDDESTRTTTAAGLRSATPMLRRELGQRLRMRFVPDLDFVRDTVPEHGRHIEALLAQTRAEQTGPDEKEDAGDDDR